jgi:hypothetical protein
MRNACNEPSVTAIVVIHRENQMSDKKLSKVLTWVAVALLAGPLAAIAAPVVSDGSTYSIYIKGGSSLNEFSGTGTFGGAAENFSRAGLNLTLSDSETDLGGGLHRISINLSADGELFPIGGEAAITGLGVFGDGLDLLGAFHLVDARIKYYSVTGGLYFTTSNLADDYRATYFTDPWSGFFPAPGVVFSNGNIGDRGTNAFSYEFTVTAVPEPEIYAMMGVGLGLMGWAARRRKQQAAA